MAEIDLISRQDALNCFHAWVDKNGDVYTPDDMPEYQAIEALPSAQRTGEWIVGTDTGCQMYECSASGGRMTKDYYDKAVGTQGFNYCPYCGSHNGSEL